MSLFNYFICICLKNECKTFSPICSKNQIKLPVWTLRSLDILPFFARGIYWFIGRNIHNEAIIDEKGFRINLCHLIWLTCFMSAVSFFLRFSAFCLCKAEAYFWTIQALWDLWHQTTVILLSLNHSMFTAALKITLIFLWKHVTGSLYLWLYVICVLVLM